MLSSMVFYNDSGLLYGQLHKKYVYILKPHHMTMNKNIIIIDETESK